MHASGPHRALALARATPRKRYLSRLNAHPCLHDHYVVQRGYLHPARLGPPTPCSEKMRLPRSLLIAFGIAGMLTEACAQPDVLPPGIYMNLQELKAKSPAKKAKLQVTLRSGGGMAFRGGSDFRISDPSDSLSKKFLNREVFAYVSNDSLFLNCERQELGPWYSLVLIRGEYLVFSTAIAPDGAMGAAVMGGLLGGAVGGAIAGAAAGRADPADRQHFILSLSTGNSRTLTKEYLIARFKDRGKTELLEKFNAEPDQDWVFILLRYAELLNASLAADGNGISPKK